MSTSISGAANRSFSSGIKLCPPASTFASPPPSRSSAIASSSERGASYRNRDGYMRASSSCGRGRLRPAGQTRGRGSRPEATRSRGRVVALGAEATDPGPVDRPPSGSRSAGAMPTPSGSCRSSARARSLRTAAGCPDCDRSTPLPSRPPPKRRLRMIVRSTPRLLAAACSRRCALFGRAQTARRLGLSSRRSRRRAGSG